MTETTVSAIEREKCGFLTPIFDLNTGRDRMAAGIGCARRAVPPPATDRPYHGGQSHFGGRPAVRMLPLFARKRDLRDDHVSAHIWRVAGRPNDRAVGTTMEHAAKARRTWCDRRPKCYQRTGQS